MKKFLFAIMVFCFVFSFSSAEAKIDDSRVALGGIVPGAKITDVTNVYGEPTDKDIKPQTEAPWVCYGNRESKNLVIIRLYPGSVGLTGGKLTGREKVKSIYVTSNNGFATPDGIRVGTPEKVLYEKYGKPDLLLKDDDVSSHKNNRRDIKSIYYYSFLYTFSFRVINDEVRSIEAACREDYAFRKYSPEYQALVTATGN